MKGGRLLPVAGFVALLLVLAWGLKLASERDLKEIPSALLGKPFPEFTSIDLLTGNRIARADLLGKPFVLNVWASWCPTCRIEHPVFNRYQQQANKIAVIGLNYKDQRADALRWLGQFGNPYSQIVVDLEGTIGMELGVYGAPETYFVDAQGIIRQKIVGEVTDKTLSESIAKITQTKDAS